MHSLLNWHLLNIIRRLPTLRHTYPRLSIMHLINILLVLFHGLRTQHIKPLPLRPFSQQPYSLLNMHLLNRMCGMCLQLVLPQSDRLIVLLLSGVRCQLFEMLVH